MKNLTLSIVLDTIFAFFCAFAGGFVIFYYFLSAKASLVFSIWLALIIAVFTLFMLKKKRETTVLSKQENEQRKKIIGQLCFLPKHKQVEEFYKALLLLNYKIKKITGGVIINGEYALYPVFTFNGLTPQDIANVKRKNNSDLPVVVYAVEFDEKTTDFAKSLSVTLKNGNDAYTLFKSANYYPEVKVEFAESKKSVKRVLKEFLSKKHSKNFVLSGFSLLFLSFLTPFKIYYVLSGCILLIFGVFIKLYGKDFREKY